LRNAFYSETQRLGAESGIGRTLLACLFSAQHFSPGTSATWTEIRTLVKDYTGSFPCAAPVIRNASVLVTEDEIYVVCDAAGDPAPWINWASDSDRMVARVDPSPTRRQGAFTTRCKVPVGRLTNYTCTAGNLLGRVTATVDLAASLRSSLAQLRKGL